MISNCRFLLASRYFSSIFLALGLAGASAWAAHPSKQAVQPIKATAQKSAQPKKVLASSTARSQTVPRQTAGVRSASRDMQAVPVSYAERMGLRGVDDPLNLNSSAALIVDADTQEILLGKNDHAVLPIASLTKLMTALLVAESGLPMDEALTISAADVDRLKNSGSRLSVGASLSRQEALHLALMSSENRAAHALARTYPGGVSLFVNRMNERARQLGMTDTHFVDPTGLSSDNQSSARDMALLVSATNQVPAIRRFSTSAAYELPVGRHVIPYRNSNRLVDRENWDISLQKTGFIREAGRCLVMHVTVAGRNLIMVLLDAKDSNARFGDAERMRRWAERSLYSNALVTSEAGRS
jgi:serine-type D-Ala-D-Ala endopeptidase (penicillin-binding protein 7)